MTDKQMEEKKREFFDGLVTEIEHYQGESEPLIEVFIQDDKFEDLWQRVSKLVEEVEREKLASFEEYIDLKVRELHKDSLKGKFESGQFWGFKEVQGELQKLLKDN